MAANKAIEDGLELPLDVRADMALRGAVEKVVNEHAGLGLPLQAEWQVGRSPSGGRAQGAF
jgi:hypothetical protein